MAETLESSLKTQLDPLGVLGQVSRQPDIFSRGRAAREALEPAMRGAQEASEEARRLTQEGQEKVAEGELELSKAELRAIEKAQADYQKVVGDVPKRNIQDFNPDAGLELATLTAILGAFIGFSGGGGRGALAAMEGITTGYQQGDQDRYDREVKRYESEVQTYKDRLQNSKQTYDNVIKLETAKKGAGAAELKKLQTQIAGTAGEALARSANYQELGKFLQDALKTANQVEQKRLEAGIGAASPSITDIVDPENPTQVLRIDAKQYKGGGVGSLGVIGLVPAKSTDQKLREDEQKTAYNTNRILQSARQIANIVKKNAGAEAPGVVEALVSSLPLIDAATNVVRGADRQIVAGAQADIIDSLLFLATGAAYNKEELAQQRMSYLPLWSDKPEAVSAKRDRLIGLIEGAKIRAGGAFTPEMEQALQEVFIAPAQQQGAQQPVVPQEGFTDEKRRKLEELRQKQRDGTLGR